MSLLIGNSKKILNFILLILILILPSCIDNANKDKSDNPVNTALVEVTGTDLFGNACTIGSFILVTEAVPDGSIVQLNAEGSVSGCLLDTFLTIQNKEAVADFIADYVLGIGNNASIRLVYTITTPDGDEIDGFADVTVFGIGIIPPEGPFEVSIDDMGMVDPTILSLLFNTLGMKGGETVTFTLSNNALGVLSSATATVLSDGTFVVDYFPSPVQGSQVLTATIQLTTPANILALCQDVAPSATVQVTVIINQGGAGAVGGATEILCADLVDNDGDMLVDCADGDCAGVPPCEMPEMTCNDGIDNDGDGAIDCADTDCIGAIGPGGITCEMPEVTCNDGGDNDGDGVTDCSDSDCSGTPACPENCTNGVDDDANTLVDCADPACQPFDTDGDTCDECAALTGPAVSPAMDGPDADMDGICDSNMPPPELDCDDGIDNDADGPIDCADTDCLGMLGPGGITCEMPELTCNDLGDNDGDVGIDCQDMDCNGLVGEPAGTALCEIPDELTCNDGFDNDAQGLPDCMDPDCQPGGAGMGADVCFEVTCNDGLDNDMDGPIDCADTFDCCGVALCETDPLCESVAAGNCTDTLDNDNDGVTDCADPGCALDPMCEFPEVTCDDLFDNDGDGAPDCLDPDCAGLTCAPAMTCTGIGMCT